MTNLPPSSESVPVSPFAGEPRMSTAAVVSLVLGILSVLASCCTFGVLAVPGLIVGIVALVQIGRSGGALTGKGLAAAGIITSAIGLLVGLVAIGGVVISLMHRTGRPAVRPRPPRVEVVVPDAKGGAAMSMVGMQALVDAAHRFADEHDGRLPSAARFPFVLLPYVEEGMRPEAPPGRKFAMNEALCGKRVADFAKPDRTVLFFEMQLPGRQVGGPELLRPLAGPRDGYVIAFLDGHIEWVEKDAVEDLIWEPEPAVELLEL